MKKKRFSNIFGNYNESKKNELKVITKFPQKWLLIDTETDEIYKGQNSDKVGEFWKKINQETIKNYLLNLKNKNENKIS